MRAMILSAGRGERMRPLTDSLPKPLLQVCGQPLIVYHLQNLAKAGIKDIVINLGYLGGTLKAYLGDGHQFGVNIQYSHENPVLETGGGIHHALPLLGPDPFVVVSADVLTDYPFSRLLNLNIDLAHLVLVDNPPHHQRGDYRLENGYITDEGPGLLNFAGIYVLNPKLFEGCLPGKFRIPDIFAKMFAKKRITGEYYQGLWYNLGTASQLAHVNNLNEVQAFRHKMDIDIA